VSKDAVYGCEGWTTKKDEKRVFVCVCAFEMKANRRVLRVSWTDKRSNECVLQILGLHNSLMETVKERIPKYFEHAIRKSVSLEKDIIEGICQDPEQVEDQR